MLKSSIFYFEILLLFFQNATDSNIVTSQVSVSSVFAYWDFDWVGCETTVRVSIDGISSERNSDEFMRIFHLRFYLSWLRRYHSRRFVWRLWTRTNSLKSCIWISKRFSHHEIFSICENINDTILFLIILKSKTSLVR